MKKSLKKLFPLFMSAALISGTIAVPTAVMAETPVADTVMATMTLYDYDVSSKTGSKYFLFGRQSDGYGTHNSWTSSRDMRITSGIAADELNENGEFELNKVYKQSRWYGTYELEETSYDSVQLTVPDTKTGKLFREDESVGVYTMPFNYNEQTGMYEYDSAKFRLTANTDSKILEVSDYTNENKGLFLPIPSENGENNFYFGAKTELPFIYTNGGTVNGKDMVYEFTGDDDVWVYVDGKLALDLGGIHGAVSGSINFRTLEATTNEENSWGRDITNTHKLEGFDTSVKNHTIQMFYLERGANFSNFRMAFNLIQPTNYTVKYYDGKLYDGKTGGNGLLATVVHSNREDGSLLYPGDQIKRSEIKVNVNDKTAAIIESGDYYDGIVVDSNFIEVSDPNSVVTTITDDDSDVVYVIFLPKPSYTVTYWTCDEEDKDNQDNWTQVTQKANVGTVGQVINVSDIDTTVEFGGVYYTGSVVTPADENGILGTLSEDSAFNVDVLVVQSEKPTPEPTEVPDEEPTETPDDTGISTTTPKDLSSDYAYIFGRSDTEMQAEDSMHRGEVAAVLYRLLKQNDELDGFVYDEGATPAFSDIDGRWDRSALEYMAYIGAYDKSTDIIRPDQPITRGEAFKLTAIALGYTDVLDASVEDYAKIFFDLGIVEGDGDGGGLRLDDPIERAEFCKVYNMIIGRDHNGLEMADGKVVGPETYGFVDFDSSDWFYDIILKATSSYDEDGYVSLELRGIRNELDDYAG